jgi:hypothetical protein
LAHWKKTLKPSLTKRNYAGLDALDWNRSSDEIAREIGRTAATVDSLRRELGKPAAPKIRFTRFDNVDWTKQDTIIAGELAVSRERVRQVRMALGKPKPINHHKPTKSFWTPERIKLLGTDTDEAVAERLKCSKSAIYTQWNRLGIPAVPAVSKRASIWKPEILAVLGSESDSCVAKRFGISVISVSRKRRELGIPSRTEREGSYKHWKTNS